MATLQTSRQCSAFTAKSRLQQVRRERMEQPITAPDPAPVEQVVETLSSHKSTQTPGSNPASVARRYHDRLSELEQRQLLLQTVTVYGGWHLVSVQNRPESDVIVAYLVRDRDNGDPIEAIREGRAMQIIMDAVGDMKVQHPRRKVRSSIFRWFSRLVAAFAQ
jgi:hypothetical protein